MLTREPVAGAPYHRLYAPVTGAGWRLVVSTLLAVIGLLSASVLSALVVLVGARALGYSDFAIDPADGINAGEMLAVNLGLILLIPLAGGLARVLFGVRLSWLSSNHPRLRWKWLWACVGMASVVWAIFLVLGTASAAASRKGPLDAAVLGFLLVVLLTTPLQAAGEEYLFRGLLLQATGGTRLPAVLCCVVNGLVFAAAHLQFELPLFADRFLLGAVLSWLAIKTGGVEAGIAIHTVKNVAVLLPAGLLDDVGDALDPSGVSWVPLGLDILLLSIIVPWVVRRSRRGSDNRVRVVPPRL